MAIVKSSQITGLDATPQEMVSVKNLAGRVRTSNGNIALAEAQVATGNEVRLTRLPSHCVPIRLEIANDDLGTAAPADLGGYSPNEGAALDADAFATAIALGTATAYTDYIVEAAAANHANMGKQLWEWLGLSADPGGLIDIVLTFGTVDTPSAGDVSWRFEYAVGD